MSLSTSEAAAILKAGGIVAFPTETVYGLGANALDATAVAKIYELKGRPPTSPVIVHGSSIEMARTLVSAWPPLAEELAQRWWPGPLTLVLPKAASIPDIVTAGLSTVGVRVPAHPLALQLIEEAGMPLAAPSANRFTELSPTTAEHVRRAFGDDVPVLDGGPCAVGLESTVVSIADGKLTLLRPGMISLVEIESAASPDPGDAAHAAPGMHPRHYSPRTPLLLVASCGFYMAFIPAYILILFVTIPTGKPYGLRWDASPWTRPKRSRFSR
jgi:L-threonylcarbamoyladenylate synthase